MRVGGRQFRNLIDEFVCPRVLRDFVGPHD
jgi:hypothetical protein